ncbi:MAG: hypothetical protein IJT01_13145 [Selenomonadaceae bacterium]|nr:hypothetical protein [Selenomonadaceae bacterium]
MNVVDGAKTLPRYDAALLGVQKGFASLGKRLFSLEKQVLAAHAMLERVEALSKDALAFLEDIRPLANRHFVKMKNKKVWFDRANAVLFPMFEAVILPVFDTSKQPARSYRGLDFEGFHFVPMTQREFRKSFMANTGNPYLQNTGGFSHFPENVYNTVILTKELRGKESHWCWVNGRDGWYSSGGKIALVPVCRLHEEDSPGMEAMQAVHAWFSKDLVPDGLNAEYTGKYEELLRLWKAGYLVFDGKDILVKKKSFLRDVLFGKFRQSVFGHVFDFAAELESVRPQEIPVPAARKKSSGNGGILARRSGKGNGELLMDEKNRVPLTREMLEHAKYPHKVYYDGNLLVDIFVSVSGNYVQGYVAAGIYRVASVNLAGKTILLYHTESAKRLFQRNVAFHSAFETFSVPFHHVFVSRDLQTGSQEKSQGEGTDGKAGPDEIDWEALAVDLKKGQESLANRLLVLEQQMKELRNIKDPAPASASPPRPTQNTKPGRESPPPRRSPFAAAPPKAGGAQGMRDVPRTAPGRRPVAGRRPPLPETGNTPDKRK